MYFCTKIFFFQLEVRSALSEPHLTLHCTERYKAFAIIFHTTLTQMSASLIILLQEAKDTVIRNKTYVLRITEEKHIKGTGGKLRLLFITTYKEPL